MYEWRYSTKSSGDMRLPLIREAFLKLFHLDAKKLVLPEQVHGNKVVVVSQKEAGRKMSGVDGLVSSDDSIVLGVLAADCVPLLFVDPKKRVMGTAHAGWRGTLANIAAHTVEAMETIGACPQDTIVSIGPHIGKCCYDVQKERAMLFRNMFREDMGIVSRHNGTWLVDLGKANYKSLIESGILPEHIELHASCTFCSDDYFSYREDSRETFGEFLGVVVWK